MLSIKVVSPSLGTFAAITFVSCVIYGLTVPARLHSSALLLFTAFAVAGCPSTPHH